MIPLLRTGSKGQPRPQVVYKVPGAEGDCAAGLDGAGSPWGRQFALPAENSILKLWGLTWEPLMPGPGP